MKDEERRPDLANDDYEKTAARVEKMMEAPEEPKFRTSKAKKKSAPATAPEIPDLPVPKEPLTIKILDDKDEEDSPEDKLPTKLEDLGPDIPKDTEEEGKEKTNPKDDEAKQEPQKDPVDSVEEKSTVETKQEADDFADKETEEAVDEIIAKESDDLLEAEDEKIAKAFDPHKPSKWQRIKDGWKNYWADPKKRWLTLAALFVLFAAAWVVPTSRYLMLNTVGVRAKLSVRVLDESTRQPLKNVQVTAGGAAAVSDEDGYARLDKVKLGPTTLNVERVAFAPINNKLTVGWGSNPQGEVQLTPVGVQYSFFVTDYLSGKPIEKVEAVQGPASAFSDNEGKLKLTIEEPEGDTIEIILKGDDLREEKVIIPTNKKDETALQMVPGRKHVFVSRREGKFDVYSTYVDGKDQQKILEGTGTEREDIVILSHPTDEVAAVVSTRDNKRNADGFLLSSLNILDITKKEATKVTESERVQLVGWSGDRLVYVQVAAGASAANPNRHRLFSYDYKTGKTDEIASSNYFNDVLLVGGKVYYAPSSTYQSNSVHSKLFKVDADGGNRQTVFDKETWNIFRVAYDKLALSVGQDWYDYQLGGDNQPTKQAGPPAVVTSRPYIDSPDGKHSIWVDNRDGKGVLLAFQPESKNELTLRQQSGLKTPLRWVSNNVVIFRINTEQETADYALSLQGGEAKKISDVTNTNADESWYYY